MGRFNASLLAMIRSNGSTLTVTPPNDIVTALAASSANDPQPVHVCDNVKQHHRLTGQSRRCEGRRRDKDTANA